MDSRFSCNICLDAVEEPVVTQCGHLYCWPCLFRWLEPGMTFAERQSLQLTFVLDQQPDNGRRQCPVCKAPCCVSNLIPIYVRSTRVVASETNTQQQHSATGEKPFPSSSSSSFTREHSQLSEAADDKNSISSTIATEEEEDGDAFHSPGEETNQAMEQEEELQLQQPVLSIPNDEARDAANTNNTTQPVPARPSLRRRSLSDNAVDSLLQQRQQQQQLQQVDNYNSNFGDHNFSQTLALSRGLALTLHRVLQSNVPPTSNAQAPTVLIPPLHRAEGFGNAAAMSHLLQEQTAESDYPDATEFLSRILLMLASFVILCLLLF